MKHLFIYDGSFEGLLTAVFEVYEYKVADASIVRKGITTGLALGPHQFVHTQRQKAERVLKKMKSILSHNAFLQWKYACLSEVSGFEDTFLHYTQYILSAGPIAENDFSNPHVALLRKIALKVGKEAHRMKGFIRFELAKDGLYFALIQPDHNVLPLIVHHFKDRFADQQWLIYDTGRKYGIYYDTQQITEVEINFTDTFDAGNKQLVFDDSELFYQQLWKNYYQSTSIAGRKNKKLLLQHMPVRYWKFMAEKVSLI